MLQRFAQMAPALAPTLEDRRRAYDLAVGFPVPEDAEIAEELIAAVPCVWVLALGASRSQIVVVLHGGGYVMGSASAYREFAYRLSAASGAVALLVDYRLAPEHPYPAAIDDVLAVYRQLLEGGVRPTDLVLVGDSAGGGLLIGAMVAIRDHSLPRAAGVAVLSPFVDLEARGDSFDRNSGTDPVVTRENLRRHGAMYLGGRSARMEPWASPNHADLAGLPPVLVLAATGEALLDDAVELDRRLREAGVDSEIELVDDMVHVWPLFGAILPEARVSVARIGEHLASCLSGSRGPAA